MPKYDVTRDDDGNAVTLTPLQVQAVHHAVDVLRQVCKDEGSDQFEKATYPNHPNIYKSRLLGRMLIDGRPPLDEKPPMYLSACAYHEVEPDLPHYYLGQVFMARQVGVGDDGHPIVKPEIPGKTYEQEEKEPDVAQLDDAQFRAFVTRALDAMGQSSIGHVMVRLGRLEAALDYIDGHGCDGDSTIAASALAGTYIPGSTTYTQGAKE